MSSRDDGLCENQRNAILILSQLKRGETSLETQLCIPPALGGRVTLDSLWDSVSKEGNSTVTRLDIVPTRLRPGWINSDTARHAFSPRVDVSQNNVEQGEI